MSVSDIAASFADTVITEAGEDDKTTIEFSDFEQHARAKLPPLATATVYETELLPENKRHYAYDRHDSFHSISGDNDDSDDDDDDDADDDENLARLRNVDNCLKKKVTEILLKNPWLASKIVQKPNGRLAMKFPTTLSREEAEKRSLKVVRVMTTIAAGRDGSFSSPSTTRRALAASQAPSAMDVIIADPITEDTYQEIVDSIRPMLHASTESAIKQNCSLWNVLLIPLRVKSTFAWSNKFLLVHSLDSCLADPATLYKIYGMLSADKLVEKLDPNRCKHLENIKNELLGGDPNFLRSKGVQAGNTKRKAMKMLNSEVFNCRTSVWTVNDERIEMIKERHRMKQWIGNNDILSLDEEPEVEYISTNDILTSWFLSKNRDATIGCLLADIRGRDPNVYPSKAGNYQAEIVYNTRDEKFHDARTPSWIRASLKRVNDEKLKRHDDRNLPGFNTLSGGLSKKAPGATIVSNWSSLCQTLALEHDGGFLLKPGIHLPILMEAHNGFYPSIGWRSMVIFRYTEDKLGVVLTAPPSCTRGHHIPLDRPAVFEE